MAFRQSGRRQMSAAQESSGSCCEVESVCGVEEALREELRCLSSTPPSPRCPSCTSPLLPPSPVYQCEDGHVLCYMCRALPGLQVVSLVCKYWQIKKQIQMLAVNKSCCMTFYPPGMPRVLWAAGGEEHPGGEYCSHSVRQVGGGVVWCGMVWYGMVRHRMVTYGMVRYRMVTYGMVSPGSLT